MPSAPGGGPPLELAPALQVPTRGAGNPSAPGGGPPDEDGAGNPSAPGGGPPDEDDAMSQ